MQRYFLLFFISGFCSILYELIWLRLTVAQFGVTTAMTSIVLSVFMAGMGAGSWFAGKLSRRYGDRLSWSPLLLYGTAELLIGLASITVPHELSIGHRMLTMLNGANGSSSVTFYLSSSILVVLTLIPWCICMGATIPLAMWAIRSDPRLESKRSFSYLYISNVMGAIMGAIIPLLLIELYGFQGTLRIGALLNILIAISAFGLSLGKGKPALQTSPTSVKKAVEASAKLKPLAAPNRGLLVVLFLSGFATMGMEVIWIRIFTGYIGPLVYSFALILASYLIGTIAGSLVYWERGLRNQRDMRLVWLLLGLAGLLPMITADPRLPIHTFIRVVLGVAPVSCVIGYLTPLLVDRWSGGDPDRAGSAYAVNILGCIVGPLFACFVLLPYLSERESFLILSLPWLGMAFPWVSGAEGRLRMGSLSFLAVAGALVITLLTKDYEIFWHSSHVLRDSTATVIASGTGMRRRLITNGTAMTALSPITKMMAHLPLAFLNRPPQNVLIICFGMGTTFRSVHSWDIRATAVELVPSVPKLFTFYHEDGESVLASPLSHVVIDDGRRFLERANEKFDVVIVDPPPPPTAAASSLLYSEEFYEVAKRRLQEDGILAQWLPLADEATQASVAHSLTNAFPYVRVFRSIEGDGWQFLASMSPIPNRNADDLLAHMPSRAVTDMMEWGPDKTPRAQFQHMLSGELSVSEMIQLAPTTPALRDDRPVNEYFLLRSTAAKAGTSK